MRRLALVLPALLLTARAQAPSTPRPFEIQAGLFVIKGSPDSITLASLETLGITHVIDLRKPDESDFGLEGDRVLTFHGAYLNCPTDREPSAKEVDAFRSKIKALPPRSKVLVHCASGNRAAGALLAYWVLDVGRPIEEALVLAHRAGLHNPATEAAVVAYLAIRMKPLEGRGDQ